MTVTVAAFLETTPPSMQITVSVTAGQVMTAATVYRLDNGIPTLIRAQPALGFDTVIVSDYEAPYGVPVLYKFVASTASEQTDETSEPTTLLSANAWLIHPTVPSLSMRISGDRNNLPSITSIGDVTNSSAATQHYILGSSSPITTVSGPRFSNEFMLGLMTKTRAHEVALNGLLRDGTPLLIRSPATFDIGLDEGFYSVGDVIRARMSQRPGSFTRNYSLPLTLVQSPIASVAYLGWSWAGLAGGFASWIAVATEFDSWATATVNLRRSDS
jgi:hypothetical protein